MYIPFLSSVQKYIWPDFLFGNWNSWVWLSYKLLIWYVWYFSSVYQTIFLKYLFYQLVALVNGLEYLSSADEFWLFDWEINPINVPSFLIFKRPNMKPKEVVDHVMKRCVWDTPNNRINVKIVKVLGKYYFKRMSKDDT